MVRGTVMLFDDRSGIVYLKGTVPCFQVYPAAYIPRALEFTREEGETSATELAKELVGLSKLISITLSSTRATQLRFEPLDEWEIS